MNEYLDPFLQEVQRHCPKTSERRVALEQLVSAVMKSRRLCRCFREYPLSDICAEICYQVQETLVKQLEQWFDRSHSKGISAHEIRAMRDEVFKQTLDDSKLTSLALEIQKHDSGSPLRKHALDEFIEALLLVHFSRRAQRSLLEEEAVSATLKHICEKIDQFQHERNGQTVQVMAWVNSWFKIFLGQSQKEHETQNNRLIQPNKAWKRVIGVKYELACLVARSKMDGLLTWIKLELKHSVPDRYPDMIVVFLLAVLLLLAQLRVTNQEGFNSTLFAIAEQSLAPPRLQEVSTGGGEGEETSILDNLPQPSQYQFLSDKLREYFREDSHRILQESIKKYPSATFQAIALKYLDSQSWQAIAETFGAPKSNLSTFSTFYYRQLEKLAPEIKKHLQE